MLSHHRQGGEEELDDSEATKTDYQRR
jgi:hypothetical protein